MALTVTNNGKSPGWNLRPVLVEIAFDSSYPTGGESLTAADVGLSEIEAVFVESQDGLVFAYDYANEKLLAYEAGTASAGLDEVDSAQDLSGVTGLRALVFGY